MPISSSVKLRGRRFNRGSARKSPTIGRMAAPEAEFIEHRRRKRVRPVPHIPIVVAILVNDPGAHFIVVPTIQVLVSRQGVANLVAAGQLVVSPDILKPRLR